MNIILLFSKIWSKQSVTDRAFKINGRENTKYINFIVTDTDGLDIDNLDIW